MRNTPPSPQFWRDWLAQGATTPPKLRVPSGCVGRILHTLSDIAGDCLPCAEYLACLPPASQGAIVGSVAGVEPSTREAIHVTCRTAGTLFTSMGCGRTEGNAPGTVLGPSSQAVRSDRSLGRSHPRATAGCFPEEAGSEKDSCTPVWDIGIRGLVRQCALRLHP